MVSSNRYKFRIATSLIITLALVVAPVLCCCADALAVAGETVKAFTGDDCAHATVPAQRVDTYPEKNQRDCADCVEIGKIQSPADTVALSQEKRQFDWVAALTAPDDRTVFRAVDRGGAKRHRDPASIHATLVALSVLLLV